MWRLEKREWLRCPLPSAGRQLQRKHPSLPPLQQVKMLDYKEDAWTDKRKETLERIKDLIQESR